MENLVYKDLWEGGFGYVKSLVYSLILKYGHHILTVTKKNIKHQSINFFSSQR